MPYKYTWTPSFKGTHSLITDLTLWELWLTWASEILLQVTPPGFKLTCIDREEANWRDSGLHGKVTLVSTLQENGLLVTNFNDQKLLVTIITNLNTSLQSKKIIGY